MLNKDTLVKLAFFLIALFFVLFGLFFIIKTADAAGYFEPCDYLNDCSTWETDFTIKAKKGGITVEGVVPDADLAGDRNPIRLIVTTGDVYTQCSNTEGVKEITGDMLFDKTVEPGPFGIFLELESGEYNITVVLLQDICANCPQAWVKHVEIEDRCKPTGRFIYTIPGNFPCITQPITKELGGGTWAINRFRNPEYTSGVPNGWCHLRYCDGEIRLIHKPKGEVTWRQETTCDIPYPCGNCIENPNK